MFSLTEVDDKAAEHPYLVTAGDLLLINTIDLAAHLSFDRAGFEADVRLLNPHVRILEVSETTGAGLDAWLEWIDRASAARDQALGWRTGRSGGPRVPPFRAEGRPSRVPSYRPPVPLGREARSHTPVQSPGHRAIPSLGRFPAARGATSLP
jgi:G3E family GTPase